MEYATPQDVADAYEGDLPEAWVARVDYLLTTTSARLTALIPALPAWLSGGQVNADLAADVVVNAVLRQLRNPEGSVTQTKALDGFTVTTSYDRNSTRTPKIFDPADLALLHPASPRRTIQMRPWPSLDRRHGYDGYGGYHYRGSYWGYE